MNFPDFSVNGLVGIRYFSSMSPWIDFVVFVPDKRIRDTTGKILEAMNAFWDGEYETYGEALEDRIHCKYLILFHDSEDTSEEYEKMWENLIGSSSIIDISKAFEEYITTKCKIFNSYSDKNDYI